LHVFLLLFRFSNNARTIYTFDVKYAYRNKTWRLGNSKWYGEVRPLLTFVTNKGTRSSPDALNLGGELGVLRFLRRSQKHPYALKPTTFELILNPRGEFDRKFDTRSFTTAAFARFGFPTYPLASVGLSPSSELGTENGVNFSNKLQKNGSGQVVRLYSSVSVVVSYCPSTASGSRACVDKGWRSTNLQAKYQLRSPFRDEILTLRNDSPGIRVLSSKARHYVEIGLKIPLMPYAALKPKYKWGSLPPAFSFLDHQYKLNIEVSGKHNPEAHKP